MRLCDLFYSAYPNFSKRSTIQRLARLQENNRGDLQDISIDLNQGLKDVQHV